MNRKVFIHSSDGFPHSGAQANYIQYLGIICKEAGYCPILIVRPNDKYVSASEISYYKGMKIIPIMASSDNEIHVLQTKNGFSKERIQAMTEAGIASGDIVISFQLGYHQKFHENLQTFCKKRKVKSIVCVLEYWGSEDFETEEKYENFKYVVDKIYLKYDGIIVISEFLDVHYKEMGAKTFLFPPFSEYDYRPSVEKQYDKWRFMISSQKDSVQSMLSAFAGLEEKELQRIELHLFGIKEEYILKNINSITWERLKKYTVVHDWIKYDELISLYQKIHFLLIARSVCQRTISNFPSKVPETMACGVVPIVSDVGDYTKYYLQDRKDSIFMKGDSADEIRKAVRRANDMTIREYQRFSEYARQTVRERFDYHIWGPKIKKMLESV